MSDRTARRCLGILKPNLNDIEGESWEELDPTEIAHGAESLRWLVWVCTNFLVSGAALSSSSQPTSIKPDYSIYFDVVIKCFSPCDLSISSLPLTAKN